MIFRIVTKVDCAKLAVTEAFVLGPHGENPTTQWEALLSGVSAANASGPYIKRALCFPVLRTADISL